MDYKHGNIYLSKKRMENFVTYDSVDYELFDLNPNFKVSKGGNSCVFKSTSSDGGEYVVKFCRFFEDSKNNYLLTRVLRFNREIEALQISKKEKFQYIIQYYFDDYKKIGSKTFHYYLMEKADYDLTQFLEQNDVSDQQRFLLCTQILQGIKELHSKRIYHRDIKPDNILFVGNSWKIGDLGLVDHRDTDFFIDETGERIGPIGWLSPEAMNKFYNEGKGKTNKHNFDCTLDAQSDVFQLGKLFWFIFQGNVPIGQVKKKDFMSKDNVLYDIIYEMLLHSKKRRFSLSEVEDRFKTRYSHYNM